MPWIELVPPDAADADLAALYGRARNADGTLDGVMHVHGLRPSSLRAHLDLYLQVMRGESGLSETEREMVAVVVSRLNGCEYCLRHHTANLKALLPQSSADVADKLATGRVVRLQDRFAAIIAYARKLTTNPHDMDADDVDALRRAGLDDRTILDLAQCVSYFGYANRIVRGLGVTAADDA